MIAAIILAAGGSRRMGVQKLLLPWGGQTVIAHIADEILRAPIDQAIVVAGHAAAGIRAALAGRRLTIVTTAGPARQGDAVASPARGDRGQDGRDPGDMLNSVRRGLLTLPPDCQAVLVALGDQPSITAELIGLMLHAWQTAGSGPSPAVAEAEAGKPAVARTGAGGIVVPVHDGKRGHPILFSVRYRQEIMTAYDGLGLRGLMHKHPDDIFELPVSSPSVLSDMDYPEDYRRELAKFTGPPGLTS